MADHAGHLAKTIIPSLQEGAIVLSDRYADSTAAYQGVTLRELSLTRCLDQGHLQTLEYAPGQDPSLCPGPEIALERMRSRPGREV